MAGSHLKVGYNFTSDLLEYIVRIARERTEANTIYEVYGSRAESSALSARPKFRIPDISREDFRKHVLTLTNVGVAFNYTLNASALGTKSEIASRKRWVSEYVRFLLDCGVGTITVTLPIIAQWIREISSSVQLEISTIAHIDTVTQVRLWRENYGINKICGSLHKNRDFVFLRALSSYCSESNIELVLMANEFCGNGIQSDNYPLVNTSATNCIFRDHCYQLHSVEYDEDDKLEGDYPMGYCTSGRSTPSVWLKMYFIRPEDMTLYNKIGINHFKITGRTGTTAFIQRVVNAYLSGGYEGNLLDLWKHLETINKSDDTLYEPVCNIPNSKLDGFIDFWFQSNRVCANENCGTTCEYCDRFYRENVRKYGQAAKSED